MGVNLSTGQVTIPASTTLQVVSAIRTVNLLYGSADNTDLTLGTVPAGKVWYIIGASLSNQNGGASAKYPRIEVNGKAILATAQHTGSGSPSIANSWAYGQCPTAAEGETIVLKNTNGANYPAYATVQYIEGGA